MESARCIKADSAANPAHANQRTSRQTPEQTYGPTGPGGLTRQRIENHKYILIQTAILQQPPERCLKHQLPHNSKRTHYNHPPHDMTHGATEEFRSLWARNQIHTHTSPRKQTNFAHFSIKTPTHGRFRMHKDKENNPASNENSSRHPLSNFMEHKGKRMHHTSGFTDNQPISTHTISSYPPKQGKRHGCRSDSP